MFFSRATGPISAKFDIIYPWYRGFNYKQIKTIQFSKKRDNLFYSFNQRYDIMNVFLIWTVFQVSDVAPFYFSEHILLKEDLQHL